MEEEKRGERCDTPPVHQHGRTSVVRVGGLLEPCNGWSQPANLRQALQATNSCGVGTYLFFWVFFLSFCAVASELWPPSR